MPAAALTFMPTELASADAQFVGMMVAKEYR
jgi:hypothetical protein